MGLLNLLINLMVLLTLLIKEVILEAIQEMDLGEVVFQVLTSLLNKVMLE